MGRIIYEDGVPNVLLECMFCGKEHTKETGYYLDKYKLNLCNICHNGSWDGIPPVYQDIFVNHLKKEGLDLPTKNVKGFYPR